MKILLTLIGAAVLATGAWAGTSLVDDSEPGRTVSLPGATTAETTAEVTTTGTTTGATTTNEVDDISGPCDEAEHANDPRCTGAAGAQADDDGDDDHGRNRGDDDHDDGGDDGDDDEGEDEDDDEGDEDRSGSNSGRG